MKITPKVNKQADIRTEKGKKFKSESLQRAEEHLNDVELDNFVLICDSKKDPEDLALVAAASQMFLVNAFCGLFTTLDKEMRGIVLLRLATQL